MANKTENPVPRLGTYCVSRVGLTRNRVLIVTATADVGSVKIKEHFYTKNRLLEIQAEITDQPEKAELLTAVQQGLAAFNP